MKPFSKADAPALPDPHLLIDGDVIAFTAAAAAQDIYEDAFGFVQPFASRAKGEAIVDNMLAIQMAQFDTDKRTIVLSCPADENFRLDIFPGYKGNRKDFVRPLLLGRMKDYLREAYGAFHWENLEADDVLGILNTEPTDEYRILVGKDKDYKTVPGRYHRLKDLDVRGRPVVTEVTPWSGQQFHLFQTLAGDAVDGYPGCPGLGKTRVPALMENPVRLVPSEGVVTRGPRKGESVTKWVAEPTRDLWAMVVSHYRKAGQGEPEALMNARLAHILHHQDYDRATGEITLWTPDRIKTA